MKGFKNTTRTQYSMGGDGYAKGGSVKGAAKISKVMGEFKKGELHSGSKDGPKVKSPKQAMAIALSEAGKGKMPMKKGGGGDVKVGKMPPLGESVKSGNRVSKMTAAEMRAMEERFGNKRRPSPGDSVKSGNRIAKEEADEARHLGVFKKGGKVRKYAEGGPVEPAMKRSMPMMTEMPTPELPMGVGAAPMKVPTTRPDPNYIQQTIMTADGRVPNPAYTADVAMNQLRTSVPGSRYYTPQELEKIMGTIENTYSQPGVTGQQLSDAYRAASVAATSERHRQQEAKNAAYYASQPPAPLSALPSDFVAKSIGPTPPPIDIVERGRPTPPMQPPLMMELPTRPPMQKIYEPRRPPGASSTSKLIEQGLQRIQQKQRPGMDPVDPGFAIDRGGYGMTAPPAGMAPVDPNKAMMMRHGGRAAMPKRGR